MRGIFGDDFLSLLSPLATAQYRPTPSAAFPNPAAAAPAPGPLSIPPATPPIRQTYNVLTGAGVPADEALAAVMNPSLMRTLAVKIPRVEVGG